MALRNLHIPLVAVLALALSGAFVACSLDRNPPDGRGKDAANIGDGGDGGSDDGGELDGGDGGPQPCRLDTQCGETEYCDRPTGECILAKPCSSNDNCEYQERGGEDYCVDGSCFCDTERGGGTCRPRFRRCQECASNEACGNDPFLYFDYVASCVEHQGKKVCLPHYPKCGPGYVAQAGSPYCIPAAPGGSCDAAAPCTGDSDCDPFSDRPVCNEAGMFCRSPCEFDYSTGRSDCPPGQTCHVDPRLLKQGNPNFGYGKCGTRCDAAEDPFICASGTSCVEDADPLLVANVEKRCRPPLPKCIRDADCPAVPGDNSVGWCDRSSLECRGGCRIDSHCREGFRCVDNFCIEKSCIEKGGSTVACDRDQFCCGMAGSVSCPAGVSAGGCYDAPNPPWCGTCNASASGSATTPGGEPRPQPSVCLNTKMGENPERPLQWHACDPSNREMCPRSWECTGFLQFCNADADCGSGGKCQDFNTPYGQFKGCSCQNGEPCPSPSTCKTQENEDGSTLSFCEAHWCSVRGCFPEQ